jgi:hypothetical protein
MDCDLQYHARMDWQGKHAKAVKCMATGLHCREIRGMVPFRASIRLFTLARICPVALCPHGAAPAHAIDAGLFQHISGI